VLVDAAACPWRRRVIDGVASVDESAITGESARSCVRRERSLFSDGVRACCLTAGRSHFRNRAIASSTHDRNGRGAKRQRTPNEIALSILLAALTLFLVAVATLLPFSIYAVASSNQGSDRTDGAGRAARVPDPTTIGGLLSAIGIAAWIA